MASLGERFRSWRQNSVNGRIFAAMLTVGTLNLAVKVAGAGKELVVADRFGTSDPLDAFLMAALLLIFVVNAISASLGDAFMPVFVRVRDHNGPDAAGRLFASAMVLSTLLLAGITALLALVARPLFTVLASGFPPAKIALTCSLFYVLTPALLITGWTSTWASILNASGRFGVVAVAPIASPLATLLFLWGWGEAWGAYALAFGLLVGSLIEAALLARAVLRTRLSLRPRWGGLDADLRIVLHQFAPLVAASFLATGTTLIDQSMAAMLGTGAVSTLTFGNRVVALIVGVSSVALSNAIFPHFSRMVAASDWRAIRSTFQTYTAAIVVVSIPVTLGLCFWSEPIVRLLFQRGSFTPADTALVARVQMFYLLQIPFHVAGMVAVRLLSALGKNNVLMVIGIVNVVVNVIGNWVLMRTYGVAGIGLSTSFVFLLCFAMLFFSTRVQLERRVAGAT